MEDLERYLSETVQQTVAEFLEEPANARRAFLACVVIDHSVNYLAFTMNAALWDERDDRRTRTNLRSQFKQENEHFRLASEVANALKHVRTMGGRGLAISEI